MPSIFYKIATSNQTREYRIVHKSAENFCFKGRWDATGKLVKSTIKNEMKYDRCANALDCYKKLRRDLSKHGDGARNRKWLEWEASGNERVLEKNSFDNKLYLYWTGNRR